MVETLIVWKTIVSSLFYILSRNEVDFMGFCQVIEYQGKKIVEIDFQNYTFKDVDEIQAIMKEAQKIIGAEPEKSVITLTNCIGLRFSPEIIELFNRFTEHNKPYVKFGAVLGIIGLQKLAYNAVMKFSGRNIPIFTDRQEALDWLVQQN
jgi:hypothetical protein